MIDYEVPGIVPSLVQPTDNTCWATAATILVSWHENQSYTIESVMDWAGEFYRTKFDNNEGLMGSEKNFLIETLGLRAEPPIEYTIEGWLSLLNKYGPLWVTTDEDPTDYFAIHARIITGMDGDESIDITFLHIIDPADGNKYTEAFSSFVPKFEEVAIGDIAANQSFRIQIIHY